MTAQNSPPPPLSLSLSLSLLVPDESLNAKKKFRLHYANNVWNKFCKNGLVCFANGASMGSCVRVRTNWCNDLEVDEGFVCSLHKMIPVSWSKWRLIGLSDNSSREWRLESMLHQNVTWHCTSWRYDFISSFQSHRPYQKYRVWYQKQRTSHFTIVLALSSVSESQWG